MLIEKVQDIVKMHVSPFYQEEWISQFGVKKKPFRKKGGACKQQIVGQAMKSVDGR